MHVLDTMSAEELLRDMGFSPDDAKEAWSHSYGWVIRYTGDGWICYENGLAWGRATTLAGALRNHIERAVVDRQSLKAASNTIKRFEALKSIFELGVEAARELFE